MDRRTPDPRPVRFRAAAMALTLTLVVATSGCASQGWLRPSAADNASQSGDSSQGSGDSSGKSADSSETSADSSDDSAHSSDGKSESKSESSEDSSRGSSGIIAIGAGVVLLVGVVFLVIALNDRARTEPARAYLETHRRPIRVSLARGSGPFVDDVATALELPAAQVGVLANTLHAHRETLDRWLRNPEVSAADLRGFTTALRAALATEPRLAPRLTATRDRLEATFGRSPR